MRRAIFEGQNELSEAQRRAGMIVGVCAQLEHAVAYLEWQLRAFSLGATEPRASPAQRQTALRAKRKTWNDKFAPLTRRLTSATKAFDAGAVALRVNSNPRLQEMRQHWNDLRERATKIAGERNEVAHTYLCWQEHMVKRQLGQIWGDRIVVSAEEDEAFAKAIGALTVELGVFTTELGQSWLRSSEQFPRFDKCRSAGFEVLRAA
jgi:hypothetical protein